MSHHHAHTPQPVLVIDSTPPRPQPSARTASEVIVLDNSPRINRSVTQTQTHTANPNTHSEPIVVEENPPKRRRRDNPAALPLHPRTTSPTHTTPPVIVVDDDDSSDPDTPPRVSNPPLAPTPAPGLPAPAHLRLPRINTRSARMQDDVIEMSARGPTVDRATQQAPNPLPPTPHPPAQTARARHTSMPPLFVPPRSTTAAAPSQIPGRRQRTANPSSRNVYPPWQIHTAATNNASATSAFAPMLPEQALPSTGRRNPRANRHVRFGEVVQQDVLSPGGRTAVSVVRDLESGNLGNALPSASVRRHTVEPFIQVVNGPAILFDAPPGTLQNPNSSEMPTALRHETHRQSSFLRSNANTRRRQGPGVTHVPSTRSGNAAFLRDIRNQVANFGDQGVARAMIEQHINAMHAASNALPLQEDSPSFTAQNPANRASTPSGSVPERRMFVRATLRNGPRASHSVANAAGTAATVAEAASATAAHFPAGLALSANPNQLSYGQGPSVSIASSRGTGAGRHGAQDRHSSSRRRNQTWRRMHQQIRIIGSALTAGIEIQYLTGIHGDGPLDYEQLIQLDEQLIRDKNRADQTEIDSLPTRVATEEDKEIRCCICMCDLEEGEELRILPCSHKYHKTCIDQWLTYNGCCPVDKKRIAATSSRRARSGAP